MKKITYADLYLDYYNNFLTLAWFGEYYGFSDLRTKRVLAVGRARHERSVAKEDNVGASK